MRKIKARYIGANPVHSMPHDLVINPGDVVDMPESEAREREDFEPVKEEKEVKK